MTPLEVVERARADYLAGSVTAESAVAAIRSVLEVTEAGAIDLLTHAESPTDRYGRALGGAS